MTTKLIQIEHCDDCPYFDNEADFYWELCGLTNSLVERKKEDDVSNHPIPDWCPLDDDKPN